MNTKLVILHVLLFGSLLSFAQKNQVKVENLETVPDEYHLKKTLGFHEDLFYAISVNKKDKYLLNIFTSPAFYSKASVELDLPVHKRDSCTLINMHMHKGYIYAFMYKNYGLSNKYKVYVVQLDLEGKRTGVTKLIANGNLNRVLLKYTWLNLKVSNDGSKVLFYKHAFIKGDQQSVVEATMINLADESLPIVKSQITFQLFPRYSEHDHYAYSIDFFNSGAYAISGRHQKMGFSAKIKDHNALVILVNPKGEELGKTRFSGTDKAIVRTSVVEEKEGYAIYGFYSKQIEGKKSALSHGMFRYTTDASFKIQNKMDFDFSQCADDGKNPNSVIQTYKGETGLSSEYYQIEKVIERKDGSISLVWQQNFYSSAGQVINSSVGSPLVFTMSRDFDKLLDIQKVNSSMFSFFSNCEQSNKSNINYAFYNLECLDYPLANQRVFTDTIGGKMLIMANLKKEYQYLVSNPAQLALTYNNQFTSSRNTYKCNLLLFSPDHQIQHVKLAEKNELGKLAMLNGVYRLDKQRYLILFEKFVEDKEITSQHFAIVRIK